MATFAKAETYFGATQYTKAEPLFKTFLKIHPDDLKIESDGTTEIIEQEVDSTSTDEDSTLVSSDLISNESEHVLNGLERSVNRLEGSLIQTIGQNQQIDSA